MVVAVVVVVVVGVEEVLLSPLPAVKVKVAITAAVKKEQKVPCLLWV